MSYQDEEWQNGRRPRYEPGNGCAALLLTTTELDVLLAAGREDLVCRYEDAIVSRFESSELGDSQPWGGKRKDVEDYIRRTLGVSVDEAESVVNRAWGLETGPYPQNLELIRALRVLASWAMYVRFAIKQGNRFSTTRKRRANDDYGKTRRLQRAG